MLTLALTQSLALALEAKSLALALKAKSLALALEAKSLALALALALRVVALTPSLPCTYSGICTVQQCHRPLRATVAGVPFHALQLYDGTTATAVTVQGWLQTSWSHLRSLRRARGCHASASWHPDRTGSPTPTRRHPSVTPDLEGPRTTNPQSAGGGRRWAI